MQEEKQRKHLEFTLKKFQDTVLQLSKEYEQEFGRKKTKFHVHIRHSYSFFFLLDLFLVEGVPIQDFFNNEKENYSQEKELERARKQLARGQTPTMSHAQPNTKRLEMSSKTPGRQQINLGKEVEILLLVFVIDFMPFLLFYYRVKSK